jgi:hypothetical protein
MIAHNDLTKLQLSMAIERARQRYNTAYDEVVQEARGESLQLRLIRAHVQLIFNFLALEVLK